MFKKLYPLHPLHHYLPYQFPNGTVIRQFSKPCLRCNEMVHSQHMYGIIRQIDVYAALAARAKCPACALEFNVACVINNQKQVRRVMLPPLLFRWYLQMLPPNSRTPAPVIHGAKEAPAALATPTLHDTEPVTPDTPSAPVFAFERSQESVGQYNGKPIPAYIIVADEHIPFSRVASTHPNIGSGEYLVDGCLIYSKAART